MRDPVVTPYGHTFERFQLLQWLNDHNNTCPVTKKPLQCDDLKPNDLLRDAIEEFLDKNAAIRQ